MEASVYHKPKECRKTYEGVGGAEPAEAARNLTESPTEAWSSPPSRIQLPNTTSTRDVNMEGYLCNRGYRDGAQAIHPSIDPSLHQHPSIQQPSIHPSIIHPQTNMTLFQLPLSPATSICIRFSSWLVIQETRHSGSIPVRFLSVSLLLLGDRAPQPMSTRKRSFRGSFLHPVSLILSFRSAAREFGVTLVFRPLFTTADN